MHAPPHPPPRASLDAVASPARLEIVAALSHGPATTRALAARLGRSRQSLYYHLAVLMRAGFVTSVGPPGDDRERRFRLTANRFAATARREESRDRATAAKATAAILRLASREAAAALGAPAARRGVAGPVIVALRGKARLSRAKLRRARQLIAELDRLFRPTSAATSRTLYSLTVVLTPAREAAGGGDVA